MIRLLWAPSAILLCFPGVGVPNVVATAHTIDERGHHRHGPPLPRLRAVRLDGQQGLRHGRRRKVSIRPDEQGKPSLMLLFRATSTMPHCIYSRPLSSPPLTSLGQIAYAVSEQAVLSVVDYADPKNPQILFGIDLTDTVAAGTGSITDVTVCGGLVAIGATAKVKTEPGCAAALASEQPFQPPSPAPVPISLASPPCLHHSPPFCAGLSPSTLPRTRRRPRR